MTRSATSVCVERLLVVGLMAGCMGGDFPADAEFGGVYDRQVALYLYPPAATGLPAQVAPLLNIESDKDGTVNLDTGITISGQLFVSGSDTGEGNGEQAISASLEFSIPGTKLTFQTETDDPDNTFVAKIPKGTYDICVTPTSSSAPVPPQKFADISISSRNKGKLALPVLDAGIPIQVKLNGPDGLPLAGARVYTMSVENRTLSSTPIAASAPEGAYWVQVARGEQELWIGPSSSKTPPLYNTMISSLIVDETSRDWAAIEYAYPAENFVVTGQVVNSFRQPIYGVTVFATRQSRDQEGSYQTQGLTTESGDFNIELPEGVYDLVFRPPSSVDISGTRQEDVYVHEGANLWLGEILLPEKVDITVTIRSPDGSPVSGAALTVQSDPDDRSNPGTSAFTDDDGHCLLYLGIGDYLVEIDPPLDSALARKVVPISIGSNTNLDDIELEPGFVSTITFFANETPVEGLILQAWATFEDGSHADSPIYLLATAITDTVGTARLVLPEP